MKSPRLPENLTFTRKLLLVGFGKAAVALLILIGLLNAPGAHAQSRPPANASLPSFDVSSIKLNKSGSGRHSLSLNLPGGLVRAINVSLAGLMTAAYQVSSSRILGAPAWFDSVEFDIEATSEGNSTYDQNRLRLQSLLTDRFGLVIHHETRQLPVYLLVLSNPGKLGPQLRLDDEKCGPSPPAAATGFPASRGTTSSLNCGDISGENSSNRVHYVGRSVSIDKFLVALVGPASNPNVDRPIVDRTGLSGAIDFTLEFAPLPGADVSSSDPSSLPSIFTALREQLGLKLESQTGPVDVLVIDHVEKPSEN